MACFGLSQESVLVVVLLVVGLLMVFEISEIQGILRESHPASVDGSEYHELEHQPPARP